MMQMNKAIVSCVVTGLLVTAGCAKKEEPKKGSAFLKWATKQALEAEKRGRDSVAVPDGWANVSSYLEELDGFEKPGNYQGTHEITHPEAGTVSMNQSSTISLGNGGNCLVNAVVETADGSAEPRHFLQILTYDQNQEVYRTINVFDDGGVSVMESDGKPVQGHRLTKQWRSVYASILSGEAEIASTTTVSEDQDEQGWSWSIKEGGETMVSGKGKKRRVIEESSE